MFEQILEKIKTIKQNHTEEVNALIEIITSNNFDATFESNKKAIEQMLESKDIEKTLTDLFSQIENIFKQINSSGLSSVPSDPGVPSVPDAYFPKSGPGVPSVTGGPMPPPAPVQEPSPEILEAIKAVITEEKELQKTQQTIEEAMLELLKQIKQLKSQQQGGTKKKKTKKRKHVKKRRSSNKRIYKKI
jgi:hypothetical protein